MECIKRAKKHLSKPDRRKLMTRSGKIRKVIPVWAQLEVTVPSDEVGRNSDCENRTVVWFENRWKNDMPVLGLAGRHFRNWKICRYVFTTSWMGLRWPVPSMCPRAPCSINDSETGKISGKKLTANHANSNKRSSKSKSSSRRFTCFQMFHTHASLPRGCFLATAKLLAKLLSRS